MLGHDDVGDAVQLRSGLIKTKMGLIIKPSRLRGDTKGGPLLTETTEASPDIADEEGYDDDDREELEELEEPEELEDQEDQVSAPQEAVASADLLSCLLNSASLVDANKKSLIAAQPVAPKTVRLEITVEGFGMIPSRYTHCYIGQGVMVLGLTADSYIPQVARQVDGRIVGALRINKAPGRRYIYGDNNFQDGNKVRNIILGEIPLEEENEND